MRGLLRSALAVLMAFSLPIVAQQPAKPRTPDPLDEARRLAKEGKYEEALAKHVWLHNHVLEERPSYYGVRLSFALGEWMDLGEKYPKAITVLKEIRDQKRERLLNSEHKRELFHDVAAINREFKESAATVSLFKKLDAASSQFASEIYRVVEGELVAAGEYALARKHLGDPMARLERARGPLQRGLERAKSNPVNGEIARSSAESIFTGEIVAMITILKKAGEIPIAQRLQTEALKTLDHAKIRNALK